MEYQPKSTKRNSIPGVAMTDTKQIQPANNICKRHSGIEEALKITRGRIERIEAEFVRVWEALGTRIKGAHLIAVVAVTLSVIIAVIGYIKVDLNALTRDVALIEKRQINVISKIEILLDRISVKITPMAEEKTPPYGGGKKRD